MSTETTVRARWIVPIGRPPLEDGLLRISGGNLAAIEPADRQTTDLDLGDVVVLPGLVNAHTHLDLGALRGRIAPTSDFTDWLRAVVAYRREAPLIEPGHAERRTALVNGVAESLRAGTTLMGDIFSPVHGAPAESAYAPMVGVAFHELIGLSAERAAAAQAAGKAWLLGASDGRRLGGTPAIRALSPHAPYSACASLIEWSARQGAAVAIHLGETREELELLTHRTGALRVFLEEMDAWDESDLAASVEEVLALLAAAPTVLLAHANYLRPEQIQRPGLSVVYCPRTHACFGHPPHPFLDFLNAGIHVALGTDSLASNPDLSVLEEMRYLHRVRPEVPPATILEMGTAHGAAALGFSHGRNTLMPGSAADWIAVPLADAESPDPLLNVLESTLPVFRVCIGGKVCV